MRFKHWLELQESGTTTSCIASFKRMVLPLITRVWPTEVLDLDINKGEKKPKKKKKKQPQVEE
jgi:hypothetical protein